jgi:hypothetical protein
MVHGVSWSVLGQPSVLARRMRARYGDAWIETAYREIMKIPKYDLGA